MEVWWKFLAEMDEEILQAFLEERSLSPEKICRYPPREESLQGNLYPLLGGSALKGKGMKELLNALCSYLPLLFGKPGSASER